MLPAIILSAKVTIDGIAQANAKLATYNKSWEKVAASAEVAGVAVDNAGHKIDKLRAKTAAPIVQDIRVEVDDQGFEDFALKKMIASEGVTAELKAMVNNTGFEEFGIKKHIAEDGVTTTLRAQIDDLGFEEFGIKKMIAADNIAAGLRIEVEGATEAVIALESLRAIASRPIIQKVIIEVETNPVGAAAGGAAASSAAAAAGRGTAGGGGGGSGFLPGFLAGGGGGGSGLGAALWGRHGGGGGGRRMPGWLGYAAGAGAFGAGVGSVGSFAGFGAEHILMTLLGIGGSGIAAGVGGGLMAAGGLGQIAVGGGSDALVMASTIADAKTLGQSMEAVKEAVWKYGSASKQAKLAQAELNHEMEKLGNTAGVKAEMGLAKSAQSLNQFWDKKTGRARVQAVNVAEQGIGLGKAYVPRIAHAAQQNLSIVNERIKPLFSWLKGPEGVGIWQKLEGMFKHNLPTSVHAFTQAIEFVLKTIGVASKYTGGFVEMVDKFFTKWNEPKNFTIWEGHMASLIETFHIWMHFLKETGKLLIDIFSKDAHTGRAIIVALTEMITKADEWVNSTKGGGELHNLFVIHKEEVLALLKIIPPLVTIFRSVYMTVAPPLVHAATEILMVIAELLESFSNTGPLARWALGLAVIFAKLGLLKPVFAWLWSQLGLMPAKLGATEAANAKLVSSNEALAASNEALAASFGSVAAASTAATEAQIATAPAATARQSVIAAQNMGQLFPEAAAAGQLSLLGTIPKNTASVTQDAEKVGKTAGASMAGGLAGGFASQIGIAFAAYGIINILTSLFSKGKNHLKEAGFELGGAVLGGIAGFMAGGPIGAMLGVGIGSLGGELLSKLFEPTKKLTPLQGELAKTAKRVTEAYKDQKKAAQQLAVSEDRLHGVHRKSKMTTQDVHKAEAKLARDRSVFGSDSQRVKRDEMLLVEAKHKNAQATRQLNNLQKLSGFQLELYKHTSVETVGADKERIQSLHESIKALSGQYERLKENNATWAERKPVLEHLAQKEKGLEITTHGLRHVLEEVSIKVNPKFAESLNHMSLAQAQFGKHLEGLKRVARESLGGAIKSTRDMEETWLNMVTTTDQHTVEWNRVTLAGLQSIMGTTNKALGSLGVSKVKFHIDQGGGKGKEPHKQHGGLVVPGSGTGDRIPLTAMVEPGEIVHVLNRNASSDMKKLGSLEQLNHQVPRFQTGGYVYPFGSGITWGRIDEGQDMGGTGPIAAIGDARIAGQGQSGWPGTGQGFFYQLLNGPRAHEFIYVYENIKRLASIGSTVKAGTTIADLLPGYPYLEMGFSDSSGAPIGQSSYTEGKEMPAGKEMHSFLEALAKGGGKAIFGGVSGSGSAVSSMPAPKIPKEILEGPPGKMTEIGQDALDIVAHAAQEYVNKHAGSGSSEYTAGSGSVMKQIWNAAHAKGANKIGAAGIIGNAVGESNLDPSSIGSGGGGLFGFTAGEVSLPSVQAAAREAGVAWDNATFQTEFMLNHGGSGLIPQLNTASSPGESARIFMEEWERPGIPRLDVREAGARAAFAAGYQKGGTLHGDQPLGLQALSKKTGDKKEYNPISHVLKMVTSQKLQERQKGARALTRVQKHIEAIGIKGQQMEKLSELSSQVEKYDEYANNANSLDKTDEKTGVLTEGAFKGHTEGEWLNEKLTALMSLRRQLIKAHEIVESKQTHVKHLFREAKKRLAKVISAIEHAELIKHKFEQQIKDIELSQNKNTQQLEKEKTQLERTLGQKEKLKQTAAVHNEIQVIREEIQGKSSAISSTTQNGVAEIKAAKEKIHGIDKEQTTRHRAESALNELVPTLENQDKSLGETNFNIYTSGGSFNNLSFLGLQAVQGAGGTLGKLPQNPPIGSVGGDIFQTQLRMQQIDEEMKPKPVEPNESTTEQLREIERELNINLKKENLTLRYQFATLANFPTVAETQGVGNQGVPFAGQFAMGGLIAATVGENGAETLLVPHGSNVVSNAERRSIVASANQKPHINFEHLEFHEADNTVRGRVNDEPFEQKVKHINRNQSRRSGRITPGGTR